LIKSDAGDVGQERNSRAKRVNSGEWDQSVQSLAGTFNHTDAAQSGGEPVSLDPIAL
jgi:hypothetical protein